MVMPDAKVLAGVNVDSAKASPFGMYVLTQMQSNNTDLQQLIALTGFDPTRDVDEVLVASALGGAARRRTAWCWRAARSTRQWRLWPPPKAR
jgi:hypothetical protein